MKKIRIRRKLKKLTKRSGLKKWGTRAALGAAAAGVAAATVLASRRVRGPKKRGAAPAKKGRTAGKKRGS